MRARVVGLTLIGLGGLAVVVGLTAQSWVPLLPADLRLGESFGTEAVSEQVTYLDPVDLAEVVSDGVSSSVRVQGDEDTGEADDDTAVWEYGFTTEDADGTLLGTGTMVVCLDRRTAEAVDCVVESIDGVRVDIRGLTARFPSGTGQRDYDLWDTTVRQALPARFVNAERLDGLQVYRFEQEVPAQVIRSVPVPGNLVGSSAEEVPADVVYGASRTLLVEPVSGVIVSSEQIVDTSLRGPDGGTGATLQGGTFGWSADTVDDALARADVVRGERAQLRTAVRWTGAGSGAALVAVGALLVARSRTPRPEHAKDEPVRVAVPSA